MPHPVKEIFFLSMHFFEALIPLTNVWLLLKLLSCRTSELQWDILYQRECVCVCKRKREREKGRECVCVCVCVCEREKEENDHKKKMLMHSLQTLVIPHL